MMTSETFNVVMRDCMRDIGVYFGNHYWFMKGYRPISSRNDTVSAEITCQDNEDCPSGEIYEINKGETVSYSNGYDVRVNSVVTGSNAKANITVTEVYIDPCEGVVCEPFCNYENHIKYYDGICVDGQCEYNIEENSVECGYIPSDPCEGVVCNPICVECDLYSQICTEGSCITDQLLEYNSLDCEYIEPEPNNTIFYGTLGLAALIGLKLLSKK